MSQEASRQYFEDTAFASKLDLILAMNEQATYRLANISEQILEHFSSSNHLGEQSIASNANQIKKAVLHQTAVIGSTYAWLFELEWTDELRPVLLEMAKGLEVRFDAATDIWNELTSGSGLEDVVEELMFHFDEESESQYEIRGQIDFAIQLHKRIQHRKYAQRNDL